ncbi:RsmB/NOP family class I SAM-dependent RNA methyltransferase [Salisaeta longa]|uniref:RsmB/NOP family class I SAM-dependent RNA methyltransferase n=1 Tax=Salisaeta longa TaxID=503170 RepID=UPI0003B58906|nr:transcription antitermination factor NusB [Salisaeta longa]
MSSTTVASNARTIAFKQRMAVVQDGAYVDALPAPSGDARLRRQVRELVAGATRWQRWLDFLLADAYDGAYDRMDVPLRVLLQLGAYELLLQETPPHAAVDQYVALAKERVHPRVGGLANALLRTLHRQREALPQPRTGDMAADLAIRQSHPTWLVKRWMDRYGGRTAEALCRWNNTRPAYGVRLRDGTTRDDLEALGVDWTPSPYLADVMEVERLQPLVAAGWLAAGRCVVQDAAAALVVQLLDPQPGETVLDPCAAPGGKTRYILDRMDGRGRVLAFDRSADRLARLPAHPQLTAEAAALQAIADRPNPPQADAVLLDAPCTGLGVLAKRADLRWRRTPDDLSTMAQRQDALLDAAARLVRPGGRLVYSTCSIAPEENEDRVAAFLDRHASFVLEPAAAQVPAALATEAGYYATLPSRDRVDGAFGARLRRLD